MTPSTRSAVDRPTDVHTVGFAVPSWPPERSANGIVSYTRNLRRALRERGMGVHLISLDQAGLPPCDDADRVHSAFPDAVDGAPARRSIPARALGKLRRRYPPWAEAAWGRELGSRVARIARRLGREQGLQLLQMEESFGWVREVVRRCDVPVVARLHGPWFLAGAFRGDSDDPASLRRIRREGRAIAAAAGVAAPSLDVLERTREFYGMPLPDARVIPIPMSPPPESARWRLDACDRDRILFVGRFETLKGGDVLIEAFRRVLERRPSARLTVAGPDHGVEVDAAKGKQSIREFVGERLPGALDDGRVEFTGRLTPAELDERRRGALTTVVLSRYETFGNTLREALILGCPVVSTAVGGLAEALGGGNALVVPVGDAEATAAAFLRLLEAPEEAAALGARAFEDCSRRYHPDRIFAESAEFYGEVIARHAASRR